MTDNPRQEPEAADVARASELPRHDAGGARRRNPALRRFTGDAAAVLLMALIGGVIGGSAWGMARPTQSVTILEGGRLAVGQSGLDATVAALMWFTGIALLTGLILGAVAHRRFRASRGLAMEAWVGVSALVMSAVQMASGNLVAGWRQPDLSALSPGVALEVLPAFGTPVAALVAPFAAMLAYWCLLFLAPGESGPAEDAPHDPQSGVNGVEHGGPRNLGRDAGTVRA